MLRALMAASMLALPAAVLAPGDAFAQERAARAKKAPIATPRVVTRQQARAASVGSNGLCQRDTGTPTGQLNFRNRCDTEEFWARILERPGAGDN